MKGLRSAFLAALLLGSSPLGATVSSGASSQNVIATGTQTQFGFTFVGVAPTDITVTYTDPSGNATALTQGSGPTQYQVSLNPATNGATWGVGGIVTYAPNGSPAPAGATLTIARTLPFTQSISIQNQATVGQIGKSAEQAADLLEMQLQQQGGAVGRAILTNAANSAPSQPLPAAAQAAGQGLCFDSSGLNIIACSVVPSGIVSSAMQPFVSATSLAAAKALLNLGGIAAYNVGAGLQPDGAGGVRASSYVVTDATNANVTAAYHLQSHIATAGITYSFPAGTTLWNGFSFWLYPTVSPITLNLQPSDNFVGFGSGQAVTLLPGSVAFITTDGGTNAQWLVQLSSSPSTPAHFVGETIKMRGTTCPQGTLAENGAAVSRSTYASLFGYVGTAWGGGDGSTTFNLPDARGYFDRNFDTGGGVDVGRAFGGSPQADQLHTFSVTTTLPLATAGGGVQGYFDGGGASSYTSTSTVSGAATGSETRPKNITALSCIWTGVYR